MTISNTKTQQKYQGNGSTVQWSIPFVFNSKEDLEIYVISSDGTVTRVTEDYSIDPVAKVLYYPLQTNGADPLPSGKTLLIRRNTPMLQQVNFDAQSDVPKSVLESSYDKAMMIAQELSEQIGRAVLFPVGTTDAQTNASHYLNTISGAVTTAQAAASAAQSAASTAASDAQANINSYTDTAVAAEASARQSADAAKLDITAAASTYLNQTDAAATYLTQSDAADAYLTQSDAEDTYLTKTSAASTYLTQSAASETYLTQSSAASTYATQSALTTGLSGKQGTLTTAQQSAVDSGIDSTKVAQIQTNKEGIAALDEELDINRPWQKPASWIDIRSGALPNSIYLLVAHPADYSAYDYLAFTPTISSSGTYDVFIDGVKQTTKDSASAMEIQWSSLALSSGYDVTYPSALKTHVVRITPTSSSNTISRFTLSKHSSITDNTFYYGILWCHFSLTNTIDLRWQLLSAYDAGVRNLLAEAITATNDTITTGNEIAGLIANSTSLLTIPTIATTQTTCRLTRVFEGCDKLKSISLKGNFELRGSVFKGCGSLQEINVNGKLVLENSTGVFDGCTKLKKIPAMSYSTGTNAKDFLKNNTSLQNTVLDLSEATSLAIIGVNGDSTHFVGGLKGLTVSSSAPLASTTSPQINVSYTGMDRAAIINLFNSMPTVSSSQVIDVTGATGAADLTADDLAIATGKGWTVTR